MISNTWKLATALGIAGVIALSAASAEARVAHHARTEARGAYIHHPSHRGSYNYLFTPRRGGFGGEPNGPDNYNPNQG